MSVSLTIARPDGETEFVAMCSQDSAEGWVAEMARGHGFRILTGVYPAFLSGPGDLEQAIREVGILRGEMLRLVAADPRLNDEDRACNRELWDRLLGRLVQLRSEADWDAYFG